MVPGIDGEARVNQQHRRRRRRCRPGRGRPAIREQCRTAGQDGVQSAPQIVRIVLHTVIANSREHPASEVEVLQKDRSVRDGEHRRSGGWMVGIESLDIALGPLPAGRAARR